MTGDNVLYKINVSNSSIFDIDNVLVGINSNAYFLESDNYNILSDHMVEIDSIKAGNSVVIYSQYDILFQSSAS